MSGWIKIHRSITDHWLYTEKRKFSKFEAWNDILLTVNFAPGKIIIKGKIILINRGESVLSLESWGKRWNWDKSSVKRFFDLLKKDNMIELKNEMVTTRLTICKYEDYQSNENASETQTKQKRNAGETQVKPIKEEEEQKEEKELSFDERVSKFLLWFNSQKEVNGFKKGNFSVLSKSTESNFKKILKTNYSLEQLNNAFKNMCNNTWVRENNKITPDHFLRIDNLEKYINQEDVVSNKSEDARVNHIKDLIEKYGTVK
jgi:hypothetical protein